ncbi:MAG: DsrE/DsrF/DrsH-like family protein [Gammaproteobacteria bacterium]
MSELVDNNRATIMLVSGDLDKAILAFEVAAGFAALGMSVEMWFALYGVNCLKKPRHRFSPFKWLIPAQGGDRGRKPESDSFLQNIVRGVNHDGAEKIPLSQLNYFGLGPMILKKIMHKKGMASLSQLIFETKELGVEFKICQICIDALALDIENDLIVEANMAGISEYTKSVKTSHYNAVY